MVAQDRSNGIWIASEGGLDKYDEGKGSFIRYSTKYGIPQALKSILAGSGNDLWIGSNQGVLLVDGHSGKLKIYDTNDGLPDNSFYQKAAMRSSHGDLFFGGNKGFTVFNPDSLKPLNVPDYFYFTDLSVNNESVAAGNAGPIKSVLAFTDTLTLNPSQTFFTIGFATINLYAPGKTRYAYQLDGIQDQWIDVKEDRRISFMRLHPGSYTLRIRYTDTGGKWKMAGKTLQIIILPPWWQTWWFRLLVFVFISAAIIALFYARVASIKKRNKLLKSEVARRTADLNVVNASLIEQYDEICLQKESLEVSHEEIKRQTDKIINQQQRIINQNHELENTVEKLEKLNSTKDYFFSILAHDLKDPVHALTEMMSFMKGNFKKIERREMEGYIDNMYNASAAVYELLINLLNWSRSQSRKIEHSPSGWSLREMIERSSRVLNAQIENKHIHLEIHVDTSHFVFADNNMMDTVFRNIISNAVKFTEYNGRIEINSAKNGDSLVVRITDSGVGMPASQIEKLFSLEKAGVSAGTAGEKGIGLGLVIAKEFIEINKGNIWVESTPEQGSSFYIQVPASDQQVGQLPLESPENPLFHSRIAMDLWDTIPMEKLVKLKGKKILIVDDNREVRDYLKMILSDTFEIFEASNGRDALKIALEIPPSVIITDILMPDMNGLDFCRKIKEETVTSHIPVVFLTSQWYEDIQVSGYKAGADVYLTKPIKKELLVQVILNLLQNQERMHGSVLENILDDKPFYQDASSVNKLDEQFLGQLVSLIESNIANPDLDARFLSKELATSRTLLYNKIKALTGQTVHEFIKSIRLRKSLKLLLEGNLSISQVAYEVGFNSHSYFDKCFIKQYKMGPKEYVNKKKNSRLK
jgi:signal transduction histidine kinase/DNA-binding response OmpR family regulator